jgi:hypothetical protein
MSLVGLRGTQLITSTHLEEYVTWKDMIKDEYLAVN